MFHVKHRRIFLQKIKPFRRNFINNEENRDQNKIEIIASYAKEVWGKHFPGLGGLRLQSSRRKMALPLVEVPYLYIAVSHILGSSPKQLVKG